MPVGGGSLQLLILHYHCWDHR